jgi:hypothetical protein
MVCGDNICEGFYSPEIATGTRLFLFWETSITLVYVSEHTPLPRWQATITLPIEGALKQL